MSSQQQASLSQFPGLGSFVPGAEGGRLRPALRITPPTRETSLAPIQVNPPRRHVPAPVQQPRPAADVPARTDTGFSQANTLVRSDSGRSAGSMAKPPLALGHHDRSSEEPQPIRSMFPTYNPDVPLNQQGYAPVQMSLSQIPRAAISRQSCCREQPSPEPPSPRVRSPVRSPRQTAPGSKWPVRQRYLGPPAVPKPCSTAQLRGLWKAANGWKASSSEGRVYCLRLSQLQDAPIYTLSSASAQPLYSLRLDPTSAAAYVTLTRYDPNKPCTNTNSGTRCADAKNGHEALTTTLQEESRKHHPNDGLVALLMPSPATKMALERADDPAAVKTAENECARLVWDDDIATHFLVHPALATPFRVTIERSPAYSRIEYTLEHHQSRKHLAKLTRDGTGGGWVEIDTSIASKIETYYIVDVAVTALILVAFIDDRSLPAPMETLFEPPPPAVLAGGAKCGSGRVSKLDVRLKDTKRRRRMHGYDIDVESQDGSLAQGGKTSEARNKLPLVIRMVIKVSKGLLKCLVCVLTLLLKCITGILSLLYKCLGSRY